MKPKISTPTTRSKTSSISAKPKTQTKKKDETTHAPKKTRSRSQKTQQTWENQTVITEALRSEIAKRAYELFEKRGQWHGADLSDWLQAEEEVLSKQPQSSHQLVAV